MQNWQTRWTQKFRNDRFRLVNCHEKPFTIFIGKSGVYRRIEGVPRGIVLRHPKVEQTFVDAGRSTGGQIQPSVRVAHLWGTTDVELAKKRSEKTIADSDRHAAQIHKEEAIELKEIRI